MVIISEGTHMSKYQAVWHKYTQFLFVDYTSVNLGEGEGLEELCVNFLSSLFSGQFLCLWTVSQILVTLLSQTQPCFSVQQDPHELSAALSESHVWNFPKSKSNSFITVSLFYLLLVVGTAQLLFQSWGKKYVGFHLSLSGIVKIIHVLETKF